MEWLHRDAKGYLSSFPLDKPAPVSVLEFACQGNEHAVFASFVTVEYIATNLAEKAYLIYTHAPMTDKKERNIKPKRMNMSVQVNGSL